MKKLAFLILSLAVSLGHAQASLLSLSVLDSGDLDPSTSYDLTTLGNADWVLYHDDGSPVSTAPWQRKAGGSGIGPATFTSTTGSTLAADGASGFDPGFSWTDGSPTATQAPASFAIGFLRSSSNTNATGDSFSVSFDATPEMRTAYLFVGVGRANGTLTASLSDNSVPLQTHTFGTNGFAHVTYQVEFASINPGTTLDLVWAKTAHRGGTNASTIRFQGAALAVPEPSSVMVLTAVLANSLVFFRRRRRRVL